MNTNTKGGCDVGWLVTVRNNASLSWSHGSFLAAKISEIRFLRVPIFYLPVQVITLSNHVLPVSSR